MGRFRQRVNTGSGAPVLAVTLLRIHPVASLGPPSTRSPRRNMTTINYQASRLIHDSAVDFEETRRRFDEQVPLLDPLLTLQLVLEAATWHDVEVLVNRTVGETDFVALARLDQGVLFSLSGDLFQATLYLVGNPVIARQILEVEPASALYAPFRVAVYRDPTGVHVAYDQPSSVFASFGSQTIDAVGVELDQKIWNSAEKSCR
jgi:Domain of unknown function DUF302